MFRIIILASILFAFGNCTTNSTVSTKASIFERKVLENGKLMVCYAFKTEDNTVTDTSVIDNTVIPQDSLLVVYQKNNPANSSLLIPPGK